MRRRVGRQDLRRVREVRSYKGVVGVDAIMSIISASWQLVREVSGPIRPDDCISKTWFSGLWERYRWVVGDAYIYLKETEEGFMIVSPKCSKKGKSRAMLRSWQEQTINSLTTLSFSTQELKCGLVVPSSLKIIRSWSGLSLEVWRIACVQFSVSPRGRHSLFRLAKNKAFYNIIHLSVFCDVLNAL